MIGLIPTAGRATRIHGLPKYLLPVPGGYLLERMLNRISVPCYIGANPDNAALLETCKRPEDTVYQVTTETMCETLLAARPYAGDEPVLMGMPDTYWTDKLVFKALQRRIEAGSVCVAAVFKVSAETASRLGVCIPQRIEHDILLDGIEDKQPQSEAQWVWGAMAWRPEFWEFIDPADPNPSASMNRALAAGVPIPLYFADGSYYDNGTPEGYFQCIRELTDAVSNALTAG